MFGWFLLGARKRLPGAYFTVATNVYYGLVDQNGVVQTIFTEDILTMFRDHDDLFLARFKKWKEFCCMMQVFPGFAVSRGKPFNGGLLKTQANESKRARKNNYKRYQKNNRWSASKEKPQSLESFLVGCKDAKR